MNDETRELLHKYNMALADEGILGKEHKGLVETPDTPMEHRLEHTRWMIVRMLEHSEEFSAQDRNLWIGFVQGVLWMNDNRTLHKIQEEQGFLYEEQSL